MLFPLIIVATVPLRDCGFSILSIISDCILTYNVVNLLKKSKIIAWFGRYFLLHAKKLKIIHYLCTQIYVKYGRY